MKPETKRIIELNGRQFLKDLKRVREVMVYTGSGAVLQVKKSDVLREAHNRKMPYYITDKIFKIKRYTMVLL